MNGPTAAVVIFFLLMCVKRLLLSLTPFLRYDTHTQTHTHTHTNTHTQTGMRVRVSVVLHLKPFPSQVNWLLRFLTVRPWDPLSSLEPLPVLMKVLKQEGLVVY